MERLQVEIAAKSGFHMLQHRMDIYGLCSQCLSQRTPLMPLTMAKEGERVVVREIAGGRKKQARLTDMGLRPGHLIEIINNAGSGRIILAQGPTRLAIGRGMAEKIMVSISQQDAGT
jgi:Fur family ferric uptake transcriptional regulator